MTEATSASDTNLSSHSTALPAQFPSPGGGDGPIVEAGHGQSASLRDCVLECAIVNTQSTSRHAVSLSVRRQDLYDGARRGRLSCHAVSAVQRGLRSILHFLGDAAEHALGRLCLHCHADAPARLVASLLPPSQTRLHRAHPYTSLKSLLATTCANEECVHAVQTDLQAAWQRQADFVSAVDAATWPTVLSSAVPRGEDAAAGATGDDLRAICLKFGVQLDRHARPNRLHCASGAAPVNPQVLIFSWPTALSKSSHDFEAVDLDTLGLALIEDLDKRDRQPDRLSLASDVYAHGSWDADDEADCARSSIRPSSIETLTLPSPAEARPKSPAASLLSLHSLMKANKQEFGLYARYGDSLGLQSTDNLSLSKAAANDQADVDVPHTAVAPKQEAKRSIFERAQSAGVRSPMSASGSHVEATRLASRMASPRAITRSNVDAVPDFLRESRGSPEELRELAMTPRARSQSASRRFVERLQSSHLVTPGAAEAANPTVSIPSHLKHTVATANRARPLISPEAVAASRTPSKQTSGRVVSGARSSAANRAMSRGLTPGPKLSQSRATSSTRASQGGRAASRVRSPTERAASRVRALTERATSRVRTPVERPESTSRAPPGNPQLVPRAEHDPASIVGPDGLLSVDLKPRAMRLRKLSTNKAESKMASSTHSNRSESSATATIASSRHAALTKGNSSSTGSSGTTKRPGAAAKKSKQNVLMTDFDGGFFVTEFLEPSRGRTGRKAPAGGASAGGAEKGKGKLKSQMHDRRDTRPAASRSQASASQSRNIAANTAPSVSSRSSRTLSDARSGPSSPIRSAFPIAISGQPQLQSQSQSQSQSQQLPLQAKPQRLSLLRNADSFTSITTVVSGSSSDNTVASVPERSSTDSISAVHMGPPPAQPPPLLPSTQAGAGAGYGPQYSGSGLAGSEPTRSGLMRLLPIRTQNTSPQQSETAAAGGVARRAGQVRDRGASNAATQIHWHEIQSANDSPAIDHCPRHGQSQSQSQSQSPMHGQPGWALRGGQSPLVQPLGALYDDSPASPGMGVGAGVGGGATSPLGRFSPEAVRQAGAESLNLPQTDRQQNKAVNSALGSRQIIG